MRSRNPDTLLNSLIVLLLAMLLMGIVAFFNMARASDLPLAAGSPLAGFSFDDRPLLLPVQRNFQMAMLTASSELGRSCGKMEAYGWRMNAIEQDRVNQIFNNTVDRMRGLGYSIEGQAPSSVSQDVTMFTADRQDRHFIFMWSAGEIGLVMVLCEASKPLSGRTTAGPAPSVQIFPQTNDVLESKNIPPLQDKTRKAAAEKFSPVGNWIGTYACEKGTTGATLSITRLKGDDFEGTFRFYPTPKDPKMPSGRYSISGQYDRESQRILVNPGKWLERPKNYMNTVMVGSFDPLAMTFSAYFQGIMGCTSFEARYSKKDIVSAAEKSAKKVKRPAKKKKVVKKKTDAAPVVAPAPTVPDVTSTIPETPPVPPAPEPVPVPAAVAPPVADPTVPSAPVAPPAPTDTAIPTPPPLTPAEMAPPSSIELPTPTAPVPPAAEAPPPPPPVPPAPPATAAPEPLTPPLPAATPEPPSPTVPGTAPSQPTEPAAPKTKPQGSLEGPYGKSFMVASGERFVPTSPPAPRANMVTPMAPSVPQVQRAPTVQQAPQVNAIRPIVPSVPQAQSAPDPMTISTDTPDVPQPQTAPRAVTAPEAQLFSPTVQKAPPVQRVPDMGGYD